MAQATCSLISNEHPSRIDHDAEFSVNEIAMGEVVTGRQGDAQECSSCIDWEFLAVVLIGNF
uniref:Uncharacterized protein n=1 Tax=Oryza punctata TaxID=4537 RepID=A0A0E0LHS5_ORYPU